MSQKETARTCSDVRPALGLHNCNLKIHAVSSHATACASSVLFPFSRGAKQAKGSEGGSQTSQELAVTIWSIAIRHISCGHPKVSEHAGHLPTEMTGSRPEKPETDYSSNLGVP